MLTTDEIKNAEQLAARHRANILETVDAFALHFPEIDRLYADLLESEGPVVVTPEQVQLLLIPFGLLMSQVEEQQTKNLVRAAQAPMN